MGSVFAYFRGDEASAKQAVDALNQFGFCASMKESEAEGVFEIDAAAGSDSEAFSERQGEIVRLARAAVQGINVSFTGNGVSVSGGTERVLLDFKHNYPLVPSGAMPTDRPPDIDEMWELLRLASSDRTAFDRRAKHLDESVQSAAWEQFGPYIRQAEAYFRAGMAMQGAAASLLYYYAFLNLAKAELVAWRPSGILNKNVHHGLSPRLSGELRAWNVKQTGGIFGLLYEKRTGSVPHAALKDLSVLDCLRRCPEVGFELDRAGLGPELTCGGFAGVFTDGHHSWLRLLVQNYETFRQSGPARMALLDMFDEIRHPLLRNLNSDFALSSRFPTVPTQLLESEESKRVQFGDSGSVVHSLFVHEWMSEMARSLGVLVEPAALGYDFLLGTSLVDEELVVLPVDLARYVSLFVVSSVVRYQPSAVDHAREPLQSYFLDAFTRQSPQLLLASFASQLLENPVHYVDQGRRV